MEKRLSQSLPPQIAKPSVIPAAPSRLKSSVPTKHISEPQQKSELPPEYRSILEASQAIEEDLKEEQGRNKSLARELTRINFEKEVLLQQVESLQNQVDAINESHAVKLQAQQVEIQTQAKAHAAALAAATAQAEEQSKVRSAAKAAAAQSVTPPSAPTKSPIQSSRIGNRSSSDLTQVQVEAKLNQFQAARAEAEIESLRKQIAKERIEFRKVAASMHREIEYLKQVHPIRGLLKAKDSEVERVRKTLKTMPKNHPDRRTAERLYDDHMSERRQIVLMLTDMENRLQEQGQLIQEAINNADPNRI